MASPVNTYQAQMHGNLGFYATWLPTDPVDVGDVGVLEGGRFRRVTTLKELGIRAKVDTVPGQADMQYTSNQGVKIAVSAGAGMASVAQVEVAVAFSGEGAFLFHASGLQLRRLENRLTTGEKLLELHQLGTWQKDWLIIESVHTAKRTTVILSQSQSAKLVLAAQSSLPIAALSLADPKAKFEVASSLGKVFQIVGADDLTPMYACLRIKQPWLGSPTIQPVRGAADPAQVFERPGVAELLAS